MLVLSIKWRSLEIISLNFLLSVGEIHLNITHSNMTSAPGWCKKKKTVGGITEQIYANKTWLILYEAKKENQLKNIQM